MNSVTLTGNVGKDPEIKTFPDTGKTHAVLSLATKRRTGRRSGEKETTDWHRVIITDTNLVKNYVEPYIAKGAMISVTGELTYETFVPKDAPERGPIKMAQIIVSDPRGVNIQIMAPSRNLDAKVTEDFVGEGAPTDVTDVATS